MKFKKYSFSPGPGDMEGIGLEFLFGMMKKFWK